MPSIRIQKESTAGYYYLTLTVRNWYYIFDRYNRFDILDEALMYCMEKKGLKIYAYVFMMNHIHMLISSEDTISFIRNFKRHTSRELLNNMLTMEPNALKLFEVESGGHSFGQGQICQRPSRASFFFYKKSNISKTTLFENVM